MTDTTYDPTPVTGYGNGSITSDTTPTRCTEYFRDNRGPNVNFYFEIDGRYYNVHPKTQGIYPVRWVDGSAPIGWEQSK